MYTPVAYVLGNTPSSLSFGTFSSAYTPSLFVPAFFCSSRSLSPPPEQILRSPLLLFGNHHHRAQRSRWRGLPFRASPARRRRDDDDDDRDGAKHQREGARTLVSLVWEKEFAGRRRRRRGKRSMTPGGEGGRQYMSSPPSSVAGGRTVRSTRGSDSFTIGRTEAASSDRTENDGGSPAGPCPPSQGKSCLDGFPRRHGRRSEPQGRRARRGHARDGVS